MSFNLPNLNFNFNNVCYLTSLNPFADNILNNVGNFFGKTGVIGSNCGNQIGGMGFLGNSLFSNFNNNLFGENPLFDMFGPFPFKPKIDSYTNKPSSNNYNLPSLSGVYNPKISSKLAQAARKQAENMNTVGRCATGVSYALDSISNKIINAGSAYQLAPILNNNPNFKQVKIEKKDLTNLPPGCIIVWEPYTDSSGSYHRHGHVAITLGNGLEASDHIQELAIMDKYSVFVPV